MDKNEYNLKLEEIDKYVNQGNYSEAAKVADTVDWRRVRNVRTLCMISEIYEADNRYEDSKALLLRAYHRSPVGRSILYRLVEVTIHLKQFDEAIEYYSEYVQAAPNDNSKYILKYKIYRGRGSSLDEQIDILKEYLSQEYNEKWAYELAKLYQQADRIQECLATCDDLVLWFHSGKYVIKALELKQRYAPLTPKQQEIYDHRFDMEEKKEEEDDVLYDETRLGQEKQIVETREDELAETIMADAQKEIAQAVAETQTGAEEPAAAESSGQDRPGEDRKKESDELYGDMEEIRAEVSGNIARAVAGTGNNGVKPVQETRQQEQEPPRDIHSELIKSMREIVAGVGKRPEPDADEVAADEVIEQSKEEQEAAQAAKETAVSFQAGRMKMPEQQPVRAGQLSIDDILLSMGEKGSAVREAASRAAGAQGASSRQPAGIVSAVEEAYMNMGGQTAGEAEAASSAEPQDLSEERKQTPPVQENSYFDDDLDAEDEDIILAKTRRIPTEEISQLHAVYGMTEPAAKPEEAPAEEPEEEPAAEPETPNIPQQQEPAMIQEQPEPETKGNQRKEQNDRPVQPNVYGSRPVLKEYHKELFNGFLGIQNMEEQIASAIDLAEQKGEDRTSRSGNILIFGGHGCGKTTIAVGIAKAIAQDRGNQFVKMAKIYAADLNRKDIAATIAKIAGGVLIIEEAGDLEDVIVDQLTTAMEFRTDGLIIILEDEQRYIHDLLMRHPRFTMKFTSQIYIPVFTIDELVRFGQIYAADLDYVFSEGAAAALYDRIGSVSAQGDVISITNVIELVDRAIHNANKFFRKLSGGKKRFDENNCIILQEKDFK